MQHQSHDKVYFMPNNVEALVPMRFDEVLDLFEELSQAEPNGGWVMSTAYWLETYEYIYFKQR